MVRIIIHIVTITIGAFLPGGCKPQPEAPRLLAEAQRLMENSPDSAMRLIDSLFYPEKSLRHEDYMRYLVLHVQARYKTHRPVAGDTLVFRARDHYSGRLDREPRMAALACFYSGCVYRERGDYEKVMRHYKEAERYFRQSSQYDPDKKDPARNYLNFATLYSQMERPDSAAFYTGKLKNSIDSTDNNYIKASATRWSTCAKTALSVATGSRCRVSAGRWKRSGSIPWEGVSPSTSWRKKPRCPASSTGTGSIS